MSRRSGPLLVIAAAALWGTTGTTQALGPAGTDPLSVGSWRLILGGLGLVAVAGLRGGLRGFRGVPWGVALVTMAAIAAYQLTFFGAVHRTGVALGTVVAIGSSPAMAGIVSRIVDRHRPDPRWYLATLLGVVGVVLIGSPGTRADAVGVLLALGAGLSYAIYAQGSSRLVQTLPPTEAMAVAFGGGALLLVPVALVTDASWIATGKGAAAVAWLGLATVTLSYVLFGAGIRTTPVPTAVTLSLAEPLTALLLAVTVLEERPIATAWAGAALVFAGLVWLALPRR